MPQSLTPAQTPTRKRPHVRVRRTQRATRSQAEQLSEAILTAGATEAAEAKAAAALTEFDLSPAEVQAWVADCHARLQKVNQDPQQNLGHIEEELAHANELQRLLAQRSAQVKANAVPCQCPQCHCPLVHQRWLGRTVTGRFGPLRIYRRHGQCPACEQWCFPADLALGLGSSTASPYVQEFAALLVSKMPAEQAHAVAVRLGLPLSRATLHREACAQGRKAQALASERTAQLDTWESLTALARQSEGPPAQPYTLVIEIDAWNIRERDDWGQTEALRLAGQEPQRWHWVYVGTVFRLDHCGQTAGGRSVISQRGYVATRAGIEPLLRQLYREAIARGLGQATRVLVLADGAAWIWNAVADRFPKADQRLDLFHADEHLWAVAHDLYGRNTPEARAWVQPLLDQLRRDETPQVITALTDLKSRLTQALQEKVQKQIDYFDDHAKRMQYRAIIEARQACKAKRATREQQILAQEPLGSGAIESTCRQYQCRFKRTGQFWTLPGDEALLGLETLWRNNRWDQLFPHAQSAPPHLN